MFEGSGLDTIKDYTYSALNSLMSTYWAYEGEQEVFEASDEPVWILGEKYDTREDIKGAQHDMLSRIWLTYRRLFPSLGDPSDMTSDRGWGCMLRCGQMLLAEALVRLNLGRSWRWTTECSDENYLRIVRLFEDQPNAPYSLHVMTSLGQATGKNIGEWYGPNTVAHLIRRLRANEEWSSFAVSVPINNVMIVDQTRSLSKKSDGSWKPLLLLLPLRLGVDTLNDIYIETLKRFFHVPQGLGILGGAPSKALFLIGYVGQDVLYLDPHTTQDSVSVGRKETSEEQQADLTYHCRCTPRMPFIRLDPSIAMCFLCKTESEFDDLITRLRCNLHDTSSDSVTTTGVASTLIEVMDTLPDYMKDSDDDCDDDQDKDLKAINANSDIKVGNAVTVARNNTTSDGDTPVGVSVVVARHKVENIKVANNIPGEINSLDFLDVKDGSLEGKNGSSSEEIYADCLESHDGESDGGYGCALKGSPAFDCCNVSGNLDSSQDRKISDCGSKAEIEIFPTADGADDKSKSLVSEGGPECFSEPSSTLGHYRDFEFL